MDKSCQRFSVSVKRASASVVTNGNTIWNSSVVVKRRFLEKIGGFSEEKDLVGSEDFDGWLRISKLSDKFERLEGVLGYYWFGESNLTSAERTLRNNLFLSKKKPFATIYVIEYMNSKWIS